MKPSVFGELVLAATLTSVAGYVDATGYLEFNRLFVSFMSGNSTRLAVSIVHASARETEIAGAVLGLFVLGVMTGRLLGRAAGEWRRPVVLMCEAALLGAAIVPALAGGPAAMLMTIAMGVQNAVIHHAGDTRTGLTYVTGTLVNLGEKLADALTGAGRRLGFAPPLGLWLGLAAGAMLGAAGFDRFELQALSAPALVLALLSAATFYASLRGGSHPGGEPFD